MKLEKIILRTLLTNGMVLDDFDLLVESDFKDEKNKILFKAIQNVYYRDEQVDFITVKAELKEMNQLEAVGGLEYLSNIYDE